MVIINNMVMILEERMLNIDPVWQRIRKLWMRQFPKCFGHQSKVFRLTCPLHQVAKDIEIKRNLFGSLIMDVYVMLKEVVY